METEIVIPKNNDNIEIPFSYGLRRYLARSFDALLCIIIISFTISTFLLELIMSPKIQQKIFNLPSTPNPDFLQKLFSPIGDTIVSIILCLLFIPILSAVMYYFGNTPGKSMFGLKVKNIDDSPLSFKKLLYREAHVWFWGYALGTPFFAIIANAIAYLNLKKNHVTSWDKKLNTEIVYTKMTNLNWVLAIFTIIFVNFFIAYFSLKNILR